MAGNDVFLWSVPGDANPNDVRLRDPTTGSGNSIQFNGIPSSESFGSFAASWQVVAGAIQFNGVPSSESFGSFTVVWQNTAPITFSVPGKKKKYEEKPPVVISSTQLDIRKIFPAIAKHKVDIVVPIKKKSRAADIEATDMVFILAVLDESI